MGNIKLNSVIRQAAFISPISDEFWPIPDQYIGVEIELEGQSKKEVQAHRDRGSPFWAEHEDGSLRNGIEYTLNQAMMGSGLRDAINYFFDNFTKFTASPRTSIHVHMNMRQDNETVEGLRNMVVLYYMYEDAFFQIADENRKWSSYCNAFEDTPPELLEAVVDQTLSIERLEEALHRSARTNVNRYYGLNLNALAKFGTLEFRHFPLVDNRERLVDWLKLLMELKQAANTMADAGLCPWDVFQTPDEVVKIAEYMPQFGNTLLGHVDAGRAFTRMVNVRNLAVKKVRREGYELKVNKCWLRFLDNQKKQGKTASAPAKRTSKSKATFANPFGDVLEQGIRPPPARDPVEVELTTLRTMLTEQANRHPAERNQTLIDTINTRMNALMQDRARTRIAEDTGVEIRTRPVVPIPAWGQDAPAPRPAGQAVRWVTRNRPTNFDIEVGVNNDAPTADPGQW